MSESKSSDTFMLADFGEHSGQYSWSSDIEFSNWITQLYNDWIWIGQQNHNPTNSAWHVISKHLNQITSFIQQAQHYANQNQSENAENQIASAKSALENIISRYPWLLAKSSHRVFVEEVRDSGKTLEAGIIVAHWMGLDLSGPPIRSTISALLQSELFERGIKDRARGEATTLKKLAGDLQTTLTNFQENERTQTTRFNTLHEAISNQSSEQQTTFDAAQTERESGWKKLLTDSQAELDRLKETYDKHMALAAPVEYWDAKRKKHSIWSVGTFIALVFGMLLAGYFLHTELQNVGKAVLLSNIPAAIPTQIQSYSSGTLPFAQSAATWHLGSLILLATLSFWFIRLLVRIFLSHLHLENDAAERVTMAKTYLALIRDGNLPKEDSINTVLAALFRPTGDGIVKDEGVPPTTLEWFTKLGK